MANSKNSKKLKIHSVDFQKKDALHLGTHLWIIDNWDYQLAFLTPGIRPAEAISRNWIRLMPN